MSIVINNKATVFQQIVDHYKRYITLGIIKENEKLPSCRSLASQLGINPNTVERAYKILEQEGYIINIAKKGVYVLGVNDVNVHKEITNHILDIKKTGISKDELLYLIEKAYVKIILACSAGIFCIVSFLGSCI